MIFMFGMGNGAVRMAVIAVAVMFGFGMGTVAVRIAVDVGFVCLSETSIRFVSIYF